MHYFALLLSLENAHPADPEAQAAEMAAYQNFHEVAGRFIRGGDALVRSATGVRISGGPDQPSVIDGPFAEGAEVAGGYYVFEADNLDDALELAAQIPAARYGAVEVLADGRRCGTNGVGRHQLARSAPGAAHRSGGPRICAMAGGGRPASGVRQGRR